MTFFGGLVEFSMSGTVWRLICIEKVVMDIELMMSLDFVFFVLERFDHEKCNKYAWKNVLLSRFNFNQMRQTADDSGVF